MKGQAFSKEVWLGLLQQAAASRARDVHNPCIPRYKTIGLSSSLKVREKDKQLSTFYIVLAKEDSSGLSTCVLRTASALFKKRLLVLETCLKALSTVQKLNSSVRQ
jgi:hypothetical protein